MSAFWEKNVRSKGKSRFNLLLLEYGEVYFEDFSVYLFPVLTISRSFDMCDNFKVQGRLKLCSKSLIFEPLDIRRPVLKFPLKNMKKESLGNYSVDTYGYQSSSELTDFFKFETSLYFEMKANDKIGPYRQVDPGADNVGSEFSINNANGLIMVAFAVVHSDLSTVLTKIENLRHIFEVSEKGGRALAEQLLSPLIETASITSFDTSQLVNLHEVLILAHPENVKRVRPLILNPGSLMITDLRIYFQPSQLNNTGEQTQIIEMRKINRIYRRRYLLRQTGLEIFMSDGTSCLFVFDSRRQRDQIYVTITQQPNVADQLHNMPTLEQMTRKWQEKDISNFDYLMHLNTEADRSFNDITQYPVFPHVIADYTSPKLDMDNPATFRDLSRPIGALNPTRLNYFKERFHSMAPGNEKLGLPPPFLYGTHYSTPGYVLFYLVRVAPEYMLCLQNGKFDAADRMFHSVADMWTSCLTNPADLKELIPEFFSGNGSFLNNSEDLNLGHRHTGERLGDVELPPWAKSPKDFIKKCAKALESDYVSAHLHEWIDLVFGYKQQGQAAVDSDNLYYYLTYEGSVDLELISDPRQRSALEMQIQEFGQTPKQLFVGPHPARSDSVAPIRVKESRNRPTSSGSSIESPSPVPNEAARSNNTASPPKSTASQKSSGVAASDDKRPSEDGGLANVLTLGDDFHQEVVRELTAAGSTPEITANVRPNSQQQQLQSLQQQQAFARQQQQQAAESAKSKPSRAQSLLGGTWSKAVNYFGSLRAGGSSGDSGDYNDFASVSSSAGGAAGSGSSKQQQAVLNSNGNYPARTPSPVLPPSPPAPSPVPTSVVAATPKPAVEDAREQSVRRSPNGTGTGNSSPKQAAASTPSAAVNTTSASTTSVSAMFDATTQVNLDPITRIEMHPSDPIRLHSDSVTGIALVVSSDSAVSGGAGAGSAYTSTYGKRDAGVTITVGGKVHQGPVMATAVSCSKDSLVKVVSIEADVVSDVRMVVGGSAGLFRTAIRRTFSGSDPPLTSCCITADAKQVITACLDNSVYR
jgi:hypothetical protein